MNLPLYTGMFVQTGQCELSLNSLKDTNIILEHTLYNKLPSQHTTVNSEFFARILFSRITLKDIFAKLKFAART